MGVPDFVGDETRGKQNPNGYASKTSILMTCQHKLGTHFKFPELHDPQKIIFFQIFWCRQKKPLLPLHVNHSRTLHRSVCFLCTLCKQTSCIRMRTSQGEDASMKGSTKDKARVSVIFLLNI